MSAVMNLVRSPAMKFALALAVPALLYWFFTYSQQQANREVEEYQKEQAANPTTDRVYINDYGLKEVDDSNHIRWQLLSKRGTVDPNGHDVTLEDVKVEYFDKVTHALKMRITAPIGVANQNTHDVKLSGAKGKRVVAESAGNGSRFECEKVELIKKNQFLASGGVIIDWPGVAKVSGNSATGSLDLGDGPKNFKVMGNTRAQLQVK